MRYACGVLLLTILSLPASAQLSGRVTGSVGDSSGAALPGAQVDLLLSGGQKPLLSTTTTPEGLFNFVGVRPATYDLTVTSKGFVKTTMRGIDVDPARETSIPQVKLELATVTQSVDVSAAIEGVDTSNAEISSTITAEQVKNLPVLDRDVLGLLQIKAGVVSSG